MNFRAEVVTVYIADKLPFRHCLADIHHRHGRRTGMLLERNTYPFGREFDIDIGSLAIVWRQAEAAGQELRGHLTALPQCMRLDGAAPVGPDPTGEKLAFGPGADIFGIEVLGTSIEGAYIALDT